jgi:SpoVK/Ycf46/Vps4 family AAA+-type ATPase
MTAESVAEFLHKPLYFVTVGELGTSPKAMESTLNQIMDIAQSWDSVVLLDEVDVFAVKREGSDIERNAMTAILLRLLERFSGVMFMTTNLKENLDPAFISRSTGVISYDALSAELRAKIWSNLLHKATMVGSEISVDPELYNQLNILANHDINGREIKNAIRLGYALAMDTEEKILDLDILESVFGLHE